MPAQATEAGYLIASGAQTAIAAQLSSLAPAIQAEIKLDELIAAMRFILAQTLGFRPSQGTLVNLLAAMEATPADLAISFPWSFADPWSWNGMPGWQPAPNGPTRPTGIAIALESTNKLYINFGSNPNPVTTERSPGAEPQALTCSIEAWRASGSGLAYVATIPQAGYQIGPLPANEPVALTLLARDQFDRLSYPTSFLTLTPHT